MRRAGADDRDLIRTYPPPAPNASWEAGVPELAPLAPPSESEIRSRVKEADR
jgi:hypothetical protein